jgi:hypothetical protein
MGKDNICTSCFFLQQPYFSLDYFSHYQNINGKQNMAKYGNMFVIKTGLRWHAYTMCFESAAFIDKKKNVFRKNFNPLKLQH